MTDWLSQTIEPPDLPAALHALILQVPQGAVTTCGTLAGALGDHRAALWIARQLNDEVWRTGIPWQRVVLKDGRLPTTTAAHHEIQCRLLRSEGFPIGVGGIISTSGWFTDFKSDAPLQQLQEQQRLLQGNVVLQGRAENWRTVAGLDIAYPRPGWARAAYVEVALEDGRVLWEETCTGETQFPYITGYLAYREIPCYLRLLRNIISHRPLADVLMLDGSGWMHPRQFGIACHLGVLLQHPTLGVSKKCLHGRADKSNSTGEFYPLLGKSGDVLGYGRESRAGRNPVYVSPGHLCSVEQARDLARQCWQDNRLPQPTYLADRLSRRE